MACQSVNERIVAVGGHCHVADAVGDLVDLPSDLAGAIQHDDVELDIEAFDGGAHARGSGSHYDRIVECFDVHGSTLWPWPGQVGGVPGTPVSALEKSARRESTVGPAYCARPRSLTFWRVETGCRVAVRRGRLIVGPDQV